MKFFRETIAFRTVLLQLIHQQITLRYRRTVFGFLWTLLNPLLNMAIIAVVFSMVMKFQINDYAIFLFSGMIPWAVFSNSLNQSSSALIANESLFKKIYLPKQIFVIATVTTTLIDSFLSTICLFIIALFLGAKLTSSLLFLPISLLVLTMFTLGISLILSILSVYFRDMQYLIGVILQALYFATPIIYPITAIPEMFHEVFTCNPLYYFLEMFRKPIYNGELPSFDNFMLCISISIITLFIGVWFFNKNSSKVIFRL
ncbi:ABC transporter permease [Franconibacter helveticus 513]|uniref:ABC transporter permease n=1 Tax=Franconibacter helveticus TaxID=357240 RepID=UPI0004656C71|nr:ABC transporter permease [Franconibacter helveticus]